MIDPIDIFSDADLERMIAHAWREAVRCWSECRAASGPVARILAEGARSADDYLRHLQAEDRRRHAGEVR